MSLERRTLLAMLGAKLVLTPGAEGMKGAIAARSAGERDAELVDSAAVENPANPAIHAKTTAWKSGKTRTARWTFSFPPSAPAAPSPASRNLSSRRSRRSKPSRGAERFSGHFADARRPAGQARPHKIQGTGAGFVPKNLHLKDSAGNPQIVEAVQVTTTTRLRWRAGSRKKREFSSVSRPANVIAAIEVAKRPENKGKIIVTIACSTGERYLSTALARKPRGSGRLTDLIRFQGAQTPEFARLWFCG